MEETLGKLLQETWASPVFGDSFPENIATQKHAVMQTVQTLAQDFARELFRYIRPALPMKTDAEVQSIVAQITPKTISFCPALTAGELDDQPRLLAVSLAIGLMYWGDQTMDRGDESMPLAIRQLGGERPNIPGELAAAVAQQHAALQGIAEQISRLASMQDAALVLDCFDRQVLMNEVRLDDLSRQYLETPDDRQSDFLTTHAKNIAEYMIIDAGFPSVSSSLYAIYRQHNPDLPPLVEIYASDEMTRLLRICNAVVRVADELGDWEMDSGAHPEWGSFCINLFNQAHPTLLDAFFAMADVPAEQHAPLKASFAAFQDDTLRKNAGEAIMRIFFDHARTAIRELSPEVQDSYAQYITLCKRVLEIGYVNRVGDIALGA